MLNARIDEAVPEPWYRQFWPWFLIVLPGTVVVAAIATMIIAVRGSDDLVADEYYKDGLAINRQLERDERARERGYSARLAIDTGSVTVLTEALPAMAELRLRLSHPMEADRDITIDLRRSGAESYTASLPVPVADNWHWLLDAGEDSDWRITGTTGRATTGTQRAVPD
ncbi:MAG: FixH family protein [Chromatocurvus sp.]